MRIISFIFLLCRDQSFMINILQSRQHQHSIQTGGKYFDNNSNKNKQLIQDLGLNENCQYFRLQIGFENRKAHRLFCSVIIFSLHLTKLKQNNEIQQLMIKHKEEIDKLRSERNKWIKHKNMLVHIYQQCDQKFPIELKKLYKQQLKSIKQLDDDEFL